MAIKTNKIILQEKGGGTPLILTASRAGVLEVEDTRGENVPLPTDETIRLPGGSSSAVAYGFDGDPNTGLWSPDSDDVALSAAGLAVVRSSSNGTIQIFGGGASSVQVGSGDDDVFIGSPFGIGSTGIYGAELGFFDTTPITRPVIAAVGSDPATTLALANSIRTILINLGLVATS